MVNMVMPNLPHITLPKSINCASACCGGKIQDDSDGSCDESHESHEESRDQVDSIKGHEQDEKASVASKSNDSHIKSNSQPKPEDK